ncbi:MAG: alpha/beta hydrolase [Rhodothermales bacterium]
MSRTFRPLPLALLLLLLLLPACKQTPVEVRTDSVTMPDGFALAATWYEPEGVTEAVLLFNECSRTAQQGLYEELARALAAEGFAVMTHDFRGTGGSRTDAFDLSNPAHTDAIRSAFGSDTRNIVSYARLQYTVTAVAGTSCGAYRLADLVDELPDLRAFVAVSGGATDNGLETLYGARPVSVLGIVSRGDASAVEPVRTLVRSLENRAEFLMPDGSLHGMTLVASDESVRERIVDFIVTRTTEVVDDGGRIGQVDAFSAFYIQGGMPMALSVTHPEPGLTRAVIETQLPGSGRILADTLEHDAWGAFVRRSFDYFGAQPERVLAGTVGDSLIVFRQPHDSDEATRTSQELVYPVIDATWANWMLGVMKTTELDSVSVPTWQMTPSGPIQQVSVYHRAVGADAKDPATGCTWWERRSAAYTLRSCVTDEAPYLLRQQAVTPDGTVQPLLEVNAGNAPSGMPSF